MAISLFPHNASAYEAAVSMLAETKKAAIIHPTGTGKSFIGFKLCEDNLGKKVLWLSPSEYIFRTQLENLSKATKSEETPEGNIGGDKSLRCFLTLGSLGQVFQLSSEDVF